MHFSGGGAKRKPDPSPGQAQAQAEAAPDRTRKRKAETESLPVPTGERRKDNFDNFSLCNSPVKKSPREGEVVQGGRRAAVKPEQQQQQQQLAPDSAALFDLLNSGYSQEFQAAAAASQQLQHTNFGFNLNFPGPAGFLPVSPPGLPHMMPGFHPGGYPPPHLLSPPVQQFKCLVCPATFEKREAFLYHLNFHSSYLDPAEAAKQGKTLTIRWAGKTNQRIISRVESQHFSLLPRPPPARSSRHDCSARATTARLPVSHSSSPGQSVSPRVRLHPESSVQLQ